MSKTIRNSSTSVSSNLQSRKEYPFEFFGHRLKGMQKKRTDVNRIKKFCKVNPETGCIEWTGDLTRFGYGQLSAYCVKKKRSYTTRIHKWILQQKIGRYFTSPEFACHTCDNRKCANPEHLYLGNALTNMRDMSRRKRSYWVTCPEKWPLKLSREQVIEMRLWHMSGLSNKSEIARHYKFDRSTTSKVIRGKRYAWV